MSRVGTPGEEVRAVKTIRELREEHGWTQLELAIKLGVTPVTVYNWERGKYEPGATMFRRIAQAFEVPMESIALIEPQRTAEGKVAA